MRTSPALSPSALVSMAVCAATGPAAAAKPAARDVARKPRLFNLRGGTRLSYSAECALPTGVSCPEPSENSSPLLPIAFSAFEFIQAGKLRPQTIIHKEGRRLKKPFFPEV